MDKVIQTDQILWFNIFTEECGECRLETKYSLNMGVLGIGDRKFILFGGENVKGEREQDVIVWGEDQVVRGLRIKYGEKGNAERYKGKQPAIQAVQPQSCSEWYGPRAFVGGREEIFEFNRDMMVWRALDLIQ